MHDAVAAYPRWGGRLDGGPRWREVARQEVASGLRNTWALMALLASIGWGAASVVEVVQLRRDAMPHNLDWYVRMLEQLRWGAVAVSVALGAPALLQDARLGALELYRSRGVGRWDYLAGKSAAVLGFAGAVMLVPALLYWMSTMALYDAHPEHWHKAWAWGLAYGAMWALLCAGVALGAGCALRSMPGTVLLVLGVLVGLEIVVGRLLVALTESRVLAVASPLAAMEEMGRWWWDLEGTARFPSLWGLMGWAAFTLTGWALVVWRHPRLRGERLG